MTREILIVDDEPSIVLSLQFLMESAGYGVRTAGSGDDALAEITASPPDLVLLDVNLPGRNGFEVCETIRANPAWRDVRIVMLTARGRTIEREKGLALGADGYITKPFATDDVVNTVRPLLDGAPAAGPKG